MVVHNLISEIPFALRLARQLICYADGRRFDPHVRQHSFVDIGHAIISTAIPSIPLIQEGQCQLLIKECALSTGKLPKRLAKDQCGYVNWPRPKWLEKCRRAVKHEHNNNNNICFA